MHQIMLRDLKFLRYWWSCLTCSVTFCWFALHETLILSSFCVFIEMVNCMNTIILKIISHYRFHISSSFVLSYYNTTQIMYDTKWLTMFFLKRKDFSQSSHRRAKPWDERWLRKVLEFKKNIVNHLVSYIIWVVL